MKAQIMQTLLLQCVNGDMLVSGVNLLHGNHEAVTRIVFHLDYIDLFDPRNVIVFNNLSNKQTEKLKKYSGRFIALFVYLSIMNNKEK